jgi:hypothetical protein
MMKKKDLKDVRYSDIYKLFHLGSCPPYGKGSMLKSLEGFYIKFKDNLQNNKPYRKCIKKHGLNYYEAFLITSYASTCYQPLNQSLFRQFYMEKSQFLILYKNLLNKSLKKLPFHSNKLVFRTIPSLFDDDIEIKLRWYEKNIGKTIMYPTFLSTSNAKWEHMSFHYEIETTYKSQARQITMFTNHKDIEDEVLFMTDTKFLIKSVNRANSTVTLMELDTQFDTNFIAYECYQTEPTSDDDGSESLLEKEVYK